MPKTSKPGRPHLLTDDLQKRIVDLVKRGAFAATAAAACGVGETTFYRWMQLGEDHTELRSGAPVLMRATSPYIEFREAVLTAKAQAELLHMENIREAAFTTVKGEGDTIRLVSKTWQASAWYLERTAPDRYGRHIVEHQGKDGGPIKTENTVKVVRFGGRHKPDGSVTPGKDLQ